jgi:hypothetical protein
VYVELAGCRVGVEVVVGVVVGIGIALLWSRASRWVDG